MTTPSTNTRGVSVGRLVRVISSLMIIAGFAALGYVSYVTISVKYFQETEAAKFSKPAKVEPVSPMPKIDRRPPTVASGDVIGTIEIDSVGVRSVIVQGDSSDILRHAVGHVPGTSLPGQPGNVALAAHRDTIFRPLRKIKAGDLIDLRTATGLIKYQVSSTQIVPPSDVGVLQSRGRNELTLITCYPFYYVGHAPDRFIVRAEEVAPSPK